MEASSVSCIIVDSKRPEAELLRDLSAFFGGDNKMTQNLATYQVDIEYLAAINSYSQDL
jgi:hypothetical protein